MQAWRTRTSVSLRTPTDVEFLHAIVILLCCMAILALTFQLNFQPREVADTST